MIFDKLKELFASKPNSPDGSDSFVRLIQLIESDDDFHKTIMNLVSLDSFNRSSMINSIISDLKLKGAPADHIQVFDKLKDDDLCEKIKSHQKK